MEKPGFGFIALKSLKQGGPPEPQATLTEIRRIYFNTTRQTIDNDLAHAIELLKSLPSEDWREKATVFMQGLSEMQREWQTPRKKRSKSRKSGRRGKAEK